MRAVGFSGSGNRPSRTRLLAETALEIAKDEYGVTGEVFDTVDLGWEGTAGRVDPGEALSGVMDQLAQADILIAATPVYNASYSGLFKHFFDLLDPELLRGKPVMLMATGGSERHTLVVDGVLRPLFSHFGAITVPTGIYAVSGDFSGAKLSSDILKARLSRALGEAVSQVRRPQLSIAMEGLK